MSKIRFFRENAGMTQMELAEKLGVTQAAIAMWESGSRNPNIITIKKLATIFGCTADDLLDPIRIGSETEATA